MNVPNVISTGKYSHKSIGIGIGAIGYFIAKVLFLVLTIIFTSIVNIPVTYDYKAALTRIGNNSFH